MPLRIPESHRVGLAKLRGVSDEEIEAVLSVLRRQASVSKSGKQLVPTIGSALSRFPAGDVEKIAETLAALYYVIADSDIPVAKFASDVIEALSKAGETFTDEEKTRFAERIVRLLGVEDLSVTSKAARLQSDFENVFHEAKVLTDVRPVFGTVIEGPPKGFVITHTLKCEYHDGSMRRTSLYIALDQDDLEALKRSVERAQQKALSILNTMGKTGIRNLLPIEEKT